jgi:hypothetical protein
MKMASLFNMITDASDLLDLFDGVDTTDQLISRLDRLKRQGKEEMLACIEGLRSSIAAALDDTLEMNGSIDEPSSDLDDENNLGDLDAELAELDDENANSTDNPAGEDAKKDAPPTT